MNDINIEIKEKGFLGIVGESSSVKITLLNSIIFFLDEKNLYQMEKCLFWKYRNL